MSPAARNESSENPAAVPPWPGGPGFASLVGQDTVVTALRVALARDRLPHALLFGGPPGVGKASCAAILARALNCAREGPEDACGECISCQKITRGLHPDLLWVYPTPRMIRIGQITPRDRPPDPPHEPVRRAIAHAPHEGRRRVVVLDQAHTMNAEAQNALLKSLEEPPSSSILVLVTPAPGVLLPTVRSRCQLLRFSPVPQQEVRRHLRQVHGIDEGEARLRAALAPGSIGGALSVDLDAYAAIFEQVVEALRLAQGGPAGVVAGAETLAGLGDGETAAHRAVDTLRVARDVLRDLLVTASGADEESLVNRDRAETWRAWAAELDEDALATALAAVSDGIDRFTTGIPPSVRLAMEGVLIDVHRALSGRPVSRPSW